MKCIFLNIRNVRSTKGENVIRSMNRSRRRSNELPTLEKKMSKEFQDTHIGKEDEALLEEQVQD